MSQYPNPDEPPPGWGPPPGGAPQQPGWGPPAGGTPQQPGWGPPAGGTPQQPGWGPPPGNFGGQPAWGPPQSGSGGQPVWPGGPGFAAPTPPPGYFFDPASGLTLPYGTQLASVGRRIGAYFLAIPLMLVTLVIGYIIWALIVWGRGQTPVQQVLGMRCYRPDDGRVAGWGWMALRQIVGYLVEGILSFITQIVSFILFASRSDHRALHDLVAGTVVLHDPNKVLSR